MHTARRVAANIHPPPRQATYPCLAGTAEAEAEVRLRLCISVRIYYLAAYSAAVWRARCEIGETPKCVARAGEYARGYAAAPFGFASRHAAVYTH